MIVALPGLFSYLFLHRHIMGSPMGMLLLWQVCFRFVMKEILLSLFSNDTQADIIEFF